ncbi:MAG TPA: thioredoxin family protein, partial [Pseudomonadota bacterium]|nr:thioredoxin family protein [Pseudomonadota bacterium]
MNHMRNLATANIYPLARVARCKRRGQRWSVAGVSVLLTLCGLLGHQAWAGESKSGQTAAAASSAPADLKTMRERARRAGKALVLEFGAKWCGPCVAFDRNVLPNRKVQAALSSVVFVHYDAEQHPGQAAARALGIVGYPT